MALSRKFLQAMGIESDKVDEIINAHRETVDALKEERDNYKEAADKQAESESKLVNVQKELDKAKQKIAEAEEADAKDKWKVKYEAMKEEYDKYKSDVDAKETKQKKTDAYRELLKESGVSEKRIAAVLKVTSLDDVEFGEDGKLKDSDKLKGKIKEEWADFIVKEGEQGANTKTPPNGGGSGNTHTPSRAAAVGAKYYESMYGTKKTEDTK